MPEKKFVKKKNQQKNFMFSKFPFFLKLFFGNKLQEENFYDSCFTEWNKLKITNKKS